MESHVIDENIEFPVYIVEKKKLRIFIENGEIMGEKKNILCNGLLANINVLITEDIDLCDYIFLDFRDYNKIKNYKSDYLKKLVIIDYRDSPNDVFNTECLKYFKRSVVNKKNMSLINYNREIIPISYCLKHEVLQFENVFEYDRYIDIAIFFHPSGGSSRNKTARFIKEKFSNYNIFVGLSGADGPIGRNSIQTDYYEKMFHSKIVVTCNPDDWEGDYRTWEALSTGSLVFVDNMLAPIPYPLINKEHIIFYDRNNLLELAEKILFYLNNPELAKKISQQGNRHALKYHKPSDRIDQILSHL